MPDSYEDGLRECPFCEIVAGRAPAKVVREWDDAIAIVPLNPVTEGHVLVLPRRHVESFDSSPLLSSVVMHRTAELRQSDPSGTDANIITSVGPNASQTVKHLHVHIVPRRANDGLLLPWTGSAEIERLREGWTQSDEEFDRFLDRYAALFPTWDDDLTPESVLAHAATLAERVPSAAEIEAAGWKQVGWYLPDEVAPERMSKSEWETERIFTEWTLDDNGGWADENEAKPLPVFVLAARSVTQPPKEASARDGSA